VQLFEFVVHQLTVSQTQLAAIVPEAGENTKPGAHFSEAPQYQQPPGL
jgi:hypothetical protein